MLAEHFSFSTAYLLASASVLLALVFFVLVVAPHYLRNKLR
jgi:inner membrane protein involved in colicin E2 resistance